MASQEPISPTRFRLALPSLPTSTLYNKAAEISNSISHLKSSNEQMLPFAEEGDDDCREAMFENLTVIGRMNARLGMLRQEVEGRGLRWSGEGHREGGVNGDGKVDGNEEAVVVNGSNGTGMDGGHTSGVNGNTESAPSGRLTDEELRRQLEAQMAEEEDGVHL